MIDRRLARLQDVDEFKVSFFRDEDNKLVGVAMMKCEFIMDPAELDKLTDHGLKANVKQKLRIAMRSMQVKLTEDLRRLT